MCIRDSRRRGPRQAPVAHQRLLQIEVEGRPRAPARPQLAGPELLGGHLAEGEKVPAGVSGEPLGSAGK
eukprot:6732713-Alexandrium_andersonii.AAC.1